MNAPRYGHTAVWTGSEMIVWGGSQGYLNYAGTGLRFRPSTDTWIGMNGGNSPSPRTGHAAVWSGSEMILWGGYYRDVNGNPHYFSTGGRYSPSGDSWVATPLWGAPRAAHTAVWTGSAMLIFGGFIVYPDNTSEYLAAGLQYFPSWQILSTVNQPSGRAGHTAVWTGSQMIVWGGGNAAGFLSSGAGYDVAWTTLPVEGAPVARADHTAVWTGSQMVIWGGRSASGDLDSGAQYVP